MAKKKSVKKVTKKKPVKKSKSKPQRRVIFNKKKINLILKNLVLFVIISLVSFVLYSVSNNEMFRNLFSLLAIIFGCVTVAFLIVFLVFLFSKMMKK